MSGSATPGFDPERVLAKSDGKSLFSHIEDCLRVFRQICRALPDLPSILDMTDFFDLLFCSVYFHDWGKAHAEFQKVLKGLENQWHHGRHELYSVPFVEMLPLPRDRKDLICRSILGHHKDFEALLEFMYSRDEIETCRRNTGSGVNPLDFQENLQRKMDVGYLLGLKKHFQVFYDEYGKGGRRFDFVRVDFSCQEDPLRRFVKPFLQNEALDPGRKQYWQEMILLGTTKLCDHMGSAGRIEIPRFTPPDFDFLNKYNGRWHAHQEACGQLEGSLFLTAPTGSGKTESALLWVRRQLEAGHQGRIFYILPYTASINAMYKRLIEYFEPEGASPASSRLIGILHGKLSQYLAQYFDGLSDNPRESQRQIENIRGLHRQMVHPLKVITPFQILKYCYGVKGFEMGFAELAGAMLIFDEIHAYDVQTFAQIVSSLKWLVDHLHVRVLIMTATLPSFMLKELRHAIGSSASIRASEQSLGQFTRHRVHILEGGILGQVRRIRKFLSEGRKVIVVCNTVANAQTIFVKLLRKFDRKASVLLHSRFIAEHRFDNEHRLLDEKGEIRLLVGTQAIEVSLDIDFDVMFTEPAPLDALIQRFGRINRGRRKGICDVYVCRRGGEHDGYIYDQALVDSTMGILQGISIIEERKLQEMLDHVYPDWHDRRKYEETRDGFLSTLNRLRPFMPYKEEERSFYGRFTGIQVLPLSFQEGYEDRLKRLEFLEAEKLLVTIHQGMFHRLLKQGLVERDAAVIPCGRRPAQLPYWAIRCRYDPLLGLLEEEEPEAIRSITF